MCLFVSVYLKECRVDRGMLLPLIGDGRLLSPWRSSIDLLQGVSTEISPVVLSVISPSNLRENKHKLCVILVSKSSTKHYVLPSSR